MKETYHLAIEMAESEQADRFQNPPRTFPKEPKKKPWLEEEQDKKKKMYSDKSASEHDKALTSLGALFSYYNDRCHENDFQKADVRRRVAISVKLEK
jgi:hypothetical protein